MSENEYETAVEEHDTSNESPKFKDCTDESDLPAYTQNTKDTKEENPAKKQKT